MGEIQPDTHGRHAGSSEPDGPVRREKEGLEQDRFDLSNFSHAHIVRSANPAQSQLSRARSIFVRSANTLPSVKINLA